MEDSDVEGDGFVSEEEKTEEQLDPENPDHFFPIVERDFNKTLANLEQNPEALQFTEDFNKLFESFFLTYTKQKELEQNNENLKSEIADKSNKIDLALKLADEDQKTINDLRKQIENAWKLADAAHAREQLAHEIIDNLRRQVENLNAEIEFKNKMSEEADDTGELSKHRDGLERERDRLINEVNQLNTKLQNAVGYQEELEKKNSEADLKINEIAGQLEDQVQETNRQKRAKEKFEADIQELKFKLDEKDLHAIELNETIKDQLKQIVGLQKDIKEWKLSHDRLSKELEASIMKASKLADEHNVALFEVESMRKTLQEKAVDMKIISEETTRYKNDLAKAQKARELMEKKMMVVIKDKDDTTSDRDNLRQKISVLVKEIEDFKKYVDEDKRNIEVMVKEKDILNKTLQRQQVIQKDQQKLIQIQEQAKRKLEVELDLFFIESGKHKKLISQLERERDRLTEEQLDFTNTIQDQLEDIRQKKVFIFDLKKEAAERDNKIRQQQNIYEAMRSDRNALQKLYQDSSAECDELRKKLKLVTHQVEQLKENVGQKEKQIIKDESIVRKLNREKEQLKIEVMTGVDQIRVLRYEVKELREEEKRLNKNITSLNRTIKDQAKDLDQLMNERDILGSQLVRRNDEIALLNEKIVILQATLARGETHYELRLNDIRLLKLEIKRLRQEKNHINKTMASMIDLRHEVFHLERDLTKSRLKCKALEQEVQNPLNIHRWRKLAGSDPEVLDLLQKIQILQKRLLQQGSVAIERERQLKQVERLYLNLRKVVARQPGPAIQEELSKTQRALKFRGNKLKCMVSELNMADLKVNEYKSDLQRVSEELADLKKKYLAEKKANRTLRMAHESRRELNHSRIGDTGEVKFTGGGFRMSVSQISSK
ncbi:cilia- and flagella-associated protein 58-like [Diorhabda carinulata]|uniref:cilia- and flagella-associated protein 58-like n=1 Tax=Diorhabda carinulata TaxID=1163345 RepID=UPI0025A263A6|nr:cilia- and flagella-associated protein 58-like [Diorhabda carinulata]